MKKAFYYQILRLQNDSQLFLQPKKKRKKRKEYESIIMFAYLRIDYSMMKLPKLTYFSQLQANDMDLSHLQIGILLAVFAGVSSIFSILIGQFVSIP